MSVNQAEPNVSSGAIAPPMTRTSTAAQGIPPDSGPAECVEPVRVSRILRVQLKELTDEQWMELRDLAAESARFCNAAMADRYCKAMGYSEHPDGSAFVRMKGKLSGDVRVALDREVFTVWRKHAKLILVGARRLAEFQADRALVCRAEHMSNGKRQRHATINFDGRQYLLEIRLVGNEHGDRHKFALAWKAQADSYIEPVINGLAAGDIRLLKVSFIFERPGRKVFALLAYEKYIEIPAPGKRSATLGPLEKDGSLWLRFELPPQEAQHFNYTGHISRLLAMKDHWGGIHDRIKRRMRRSGRGWKHDYRSSLTKAGSFSAWAHGFIHEWSADIVNRCRHAGVGYLRIAPIKHNDLPMAELEEKLKYKCQEAGIIMASFDPVEKTSERAIKGVLRKKQRSIAKAKESLNYLKTHLQEK